MNFRAFRIHEIDGRIEARFETLTLDDLTPGAVIVKVHYSSINYKDALAATGAGKILRRYPLVGGIDLAGEVVESQDDRYGPGQQVVVTGCSLSETYDGGYAEYARVEGDSVIPIPEGLDPLTCMVLGTAGFTAGLAIHRMEHNGLTPGNGEVVVTGASGGVGSLATDMLAGRGYRTVGLTGKRGAHDYLQQLGAARVLARDEVDFGRRPLEKALWTGAIDNVGGETLTWLTRTMDFWGSIASIGLAGSAELHTTVMPFILRGVNLLGINSSATRRPVRLDVWKRLASDLRPRHFDLIRSRIVEFDDLPGAFQDYLDNKVRGRTVVRIAG
jgi:acrylyl-CoA reductase (NADPH)